MIENVIEIKIAIMINVVTSAKIQKKCIWKRLYLESCHLQTCKNGKYLTSIADDLKIYI